MSKIKLLDVTIKNFCSFGNDETKFEYTSGINVVTGHAHKSTTRNGIGKSTLLVDAASFAIYGKPLRGKKVKIGDLVNNVNKKSCSVNLRLQVDDVILRIVRTLKPSSLEIFVNDSESPKKFDSMDHTQKWLESKIGISHTCFANILVLNVNSSEPFLMMDKANKREVIEDILTLSIYGRMAEYAKNKHLDAKSDIRVFEAEFKAAVRSLSMAKEGREGIDEERKKFEKEKEVNIKKLSVEIEKLKKLNESITSKINWTDLSSKLEGFKTKKDELITIKTEIKSQLSDLVKRSSEAKEVLETLSEESHCPLCKSSIGSDNEISKRYIEDCKKIVEENKKHHLEKSKELGNIEDEITKNTRNILKAEEYISIQNNSRSEIKINEDKISRREKELETIKKSEFIAGGIISDERMAELIEEAKEKEAHFNTAEKEYNYFGQIRKLLGEKGMRKFVVSKILPFLNMKVNEHLKNIGSEYTLKFDSNLEEVIFNKVRDERSYSSLSSGERKRVDLAILMSFMDVAKMQNSVDTNILVLDEVLDTSMDNDGVEAFLSYLKNQFKVKYPDKCVYIITHRKEISDDSFDRLINIVKKGGFTYIDSIVEMG